MQLLFIPEFAPQQLGRVVGDFPQPLLQGLALFGIRLVETGRCGGWVVLSSSPGCELPGPCALLAFSPWAWAEACSSLPGVP